MTDDFILGLFNRTLFPTHQTYTVQETWAKAAREVMRNPAVRQCAATGWWAGTPRVFVQNNLQVNITVARAAEPGASAPASALGARLLAVSR